MIIICHLNTVLNCVTQHLKIYHPLSYTTEYWSSFVFIKKFLNEKNNTASSQTGWQKGRTYPKNRIYHTYNKVRLRKIILLHRTLSNKNKVNNKKKKKQIFLHQTSLVLFTKNCFFLQNGPYLFDRIHLLWIYMRSIFRD